MIELYYYQHHYYYCATILCQKTYYDINNTMLLYCCCRRTSVYLYSSSILVHQWKATNPTRPLCYLVYISVPSNEPVAHGKRSRRSSYSKHGNSIIAGPSHDLRQPSCVPLAHTHSSTLDTEDSSSPSITAYPLYPKATKHEMKPSRHMLLSLIPVIHPLARPVLTFQLLGARKSPACGRHSCYATGTGDIGVILVEDSPSSVAAP